MQVTKAASFMILWVLVLLMPGPALAQIGAVELVKTAAWGTPPAMVRHGLVVPAAVVANERVETAVQGGLHLRFLDDTEFRLGSGSSAVLDQFIYNPSTKTGVFVSSIVKGAFRVITGKMNKNGFRIFTPVAVIGVRGTDFYITVGLAGLTTVSVLSGSVTITPLGGSPVSVAAGQAASVGAVASPAQSVSPPSAPDPGLGDAAGGADGEVQGFDADGGGGGGGGD